MKKFAVYHSVKANPEAEELIQRVFVYELFADTLDTVLIECQNELSDSYRVLEIRNTWIGDIIQDKETGACYLILEKGFKSVPKNVLNYIDWGHEINRIICIKRLTNSISNENKEQIGKGTFISSSSL